MLTSRFLYGGSRSGCSAPHRVRAWLEAEVLLSGTKDKELFKIDGATHIETYWVPSMWTPG